MADFVVKVVDGSPLVVKIAGVEFLLPFINQASGYVEAAEASAAAAATSEAHTVDLFNQINAIFRFDLSDPNWAFAVKDTNDRVALGIAPSGLVFGAGLLTKKSVGQYPDLMQIVLSAQSLGEGAESFLAGGGVISTVDGGWASQRFLRGNRTWQGNDWPTRPDKRAAGQFVLVPQTATAVGLLGETVSTGLADGLKAGLSGMFSTRGQTDVSPHVIVTAAVRGSTRLTAITSEDTGNTTHGTSTTNLTTATGAKVLVTQPGLAYVPGAQIRIANAAWVPGGPGGTLYDFSPYFSGTVTAYNAATGDMTINAVAVSTGGLASHNNWRLLRDDWSAPGNYYGTTLDDVRRGAAAASTLGMSHGVAAVLHMQGERNGDLKIYEYDTAVSAMAVAIASYRDKLKVHADQLDTDIRAITGQTRKIPFFTYQTASFPAAQAQLEASATNGSLFMVGPHYAAPAGWNGSSVGGGAPTWGDPIHKSADGERMYGELCSKVMRRVLFEKENWRGLRPIAAVKFDNTHFDVTFEVPRPPLVLETAWLAKAAQFGFQVRTGTIDAPGAGVTITGAALLNGTTVRFTTGANLPAGAYLETQSAACDMGIAPAIIAVGPAAASGAGFAQDFMTIAGNQLATLAPLTNEGAFYVTSPGKSAIIRSVTFDGANTVLVGETRVGQRTGVFAAGNVLGFSRAHYYTSLRDSDPELAIYSFADPAYPARLGQSYPLWNWCCLFTGLPIQGT